MLRKKRKTEEGAARCRVYQNDPPADPQQLSASARILRNLTLVTTDNPDGTKQLSITTTQAIALSVQQNNQPDQPKINIMTSYKHTRTFVYANPSNNDQTAPPIRQQPDRKCKHSARR